MTHITRFTVSAPNPHDHLFHVRMTWEGGPSHDEPVLLKMPVWSPGSYLVREYPRHVQSVRAHDAKGRSLTITQVDKASWLLHPHGASAVEVVYEVFSHELAVRTNHLDATHGSLNGVATYMYHDDLLDHPVEVTFELPEGWDVYGGMDALDEDAKRYGVQNFDLLYDTPVELGVYEPLQFEVAGVPHEVVIWGEGNFDEERLVEDMARSVRAHADLFGGLPYDHYTFILHLSDRGRGGLEHHNSTILLYPQDGFRQGPEGSEVDEHGQPQHGYLEYLRLVSHEHFHVWNVKRIRPEVLGPFDYGGENYTRDLWTVEGVTCYYEILALRRAGLMTPEKFLEALADSAKVLSGIPGRALHSLESSSLNAWVKLYRPDENTRNSSVSYYLKGELVSFLLDARIRAQTRNAYSLDDVLLALWTHYEETGAGYAEGSYGDWVERVTGVDVEDFLDAYVRGTQELDYEGELEPFGLKLDIKRGANQSGGWLGLKTQRSGEALQVTSTLTDSPAQRAGIYAGDELVALDGRKIGGDLDAILARHAPQTTLTMHLFRRGILHETEVELGESPASEWAFRVREDATPAQHALRVAWLGELEST